MYIIMTKGRQIYWGQCLPLPKNLSLHWMRKKNVISNPQLLEKIERIWILSIRSGKCSGLASRAPPDHEDWRNIKGAFPLPHSVKALFACTLLSELTAVAPSPTGWPLTPRLLCSSRQGSHCTNIKLRVRALPVPQRRHTVSAFVPKQPNCLSGNVSERSDHSTHLL